MQEILRGKCLKEVSYASYTAPFGDFLLITYQKKVCGLYFIDDSDILEIARKDLNFIHAEEKQIYSLEAIVARQVPLCLIGSAFDLNVWRALLSIDRGQLISYSELAWRAGSPKAHRAVGSAIGRNPISYLIPCHRVIRSDQTLGGYRFGLKQKQKLIDFETLVATHSDQERVRLR